MAGKRLVVLISGSGTNLQALLDRDDLGGEVVSVLSDRAGAGGLDRARKRRVKAAVVPFAEYPERRAWEEALADRVAVAAPDLVVLAGFMKVLSPRFVERWPIMNLHPSLLPAFPGAHAVADALAWGVRLSGCTVHFVDEQVDHGPIILQEAVPVLDDDTEASLHARIQRVEHRLLPAAIQAFCHDRLQIDGRQVRFRW